MNDTLSIRERILLHLRHTADRFGEQACSASTQYGIAEALLITRSHASVELERASARGFVQSKLLHVPGYAREMKVYQLTPLGFREAEALMERIEILKIRNEMLSGRAHTSADRLLSALSEMEKISICALKSAGRPLKAETLGARERIPFTVRLRDGSISLSVDAGPVADALSSDERVKKMADSLLADYFLREGKYDERLKFLCSSKRMGEAIRLIKYHSSSLETEEALLPLLKSLEEEFQQEACFNRLLAKISLLAEEENTAANALARIAQPTLEDELMKLMLEKRRVGEEMTARARRAGERERSMVHRAMAALLASEGRCTEAESEIEASINIAMKAGDAYELRMAYVALARIKKGRGEDNAVRRIQAKLRSMGERTSFN